MPATAANPGPVTRTARHRHQFTFDRAPGLPICACPISLTNARPTVAKPELGLKRLCPSCGARYYYLNRSPILCPKCGTQFDAGLAARARPSTAIDDEEDSEEEITEVGTLTPEFVSLEDAEDADGDDVPDIEDPDIEDETPEDDVFLEEEDEDGGDMSDLIGDVGDEEEH